MAAMAQLLGHDAASKQLLEVVAFDHLLLEDLLGDRFEQPPVVVQDRQRLVMGVVD